MPEQAIETVIGFWRIAEQDRERLAIVDPLGHEIRYGELYDQVNQISNAFRARGLVQGDHISIVLPNEPMHLALCLAAMQSGLYITTINWHLVGPEIAYILTDSESKLFVAHESIGHEAIRAADEAGLPADQRLAIGEIQGFSPLEEFMQGQPCSRPENPRAGSLMFYTSGTTGRPKGVRRPLGDVSPDDAAAAIMGLFALFDIHPHDGHVHITPAPLYHSAPNSWAITSLHCGHPVVLMDHFTPEGMMERIARYRVSHTHMVPTMFHRLLALPEDVRASYDVSSLRTMIHAAAPCPVATKWKMLDWWGDVIWEYYSATEVGGTIISPSDWRKHPGTVGRPFPGSEVKVLDDDGNELATGQSGTIYMRMEGVSFEYYKDREKTEKASRKGFVTVGDIGYLDADGYLFLNDRKNDMIIVAGVNLYPAEIESALQQHDKIVDVAVFGIPNADTGEEIKAVIELSPGTSADDRTRAEIMEFCKGQLAKQRWPRSIDFTTEMPRDPSGKLYKRKLRDPYWEEHDSSIV